MPRLCALLPPAVDLAARIALTCLLLLVLYRAAFWVLFRRAARGVPRRELLRAAGLGLRFDLRLALLLALPALLLAWLPGAGPQDGSLALAAWRAWLSASLGLIALIHLVDLAHYDYLHARLDATVVEHLDAPGVALRAGWEGFPVLRGLLALLAALALQTLLVQVFVLARRTVPPPVGGPAAAAWCVAFALLLLGLHGRLARFPLRWSDAYFSTSPFVAALALNPVLFLRSTWPNRHSAADARTARSLYPALVATLRVERPDPDRLALSRTLQPRGRPARPPNVVIVLVESFAGYKVGAFGNALDPTPCIDALARESLLFTHHFAVTAPTARAVFSLLTGIPDVNPVHSASRNPLAVRQRTLVNAFAQHRRHYFIGGSASWGNIRGLLAHNIPGMRIHEEGAYAAPRVDGWGISDRQLFAEAAAALGRERGPFFAIVHTSGNHRPWTIPEDRGDFRLRSVDAATLSANGFDSLAEFNSFRFMDHSLGHFLQLARRQAWHADTLYFVLGDHGAGAPQESGWERLGLTHVHTPLIVHGPRELLGAPRRIGSVASSLDVLPTALSLCGLPAENPTLGTDALDARPPSQRFAFVRRPPCHGLVAHDAFVLLHPRRAPQLFAYRSADPCRDLAAERPEETERLALLGRAYLETSRCLLAGATEGRDEVAQRLREALAT
jgi:phosphoglycerol transferase MdoB-like AlkP superfamily enzyme